MQTLTAFSKNCTWSTYLVYARNPSISSALLLVLVHVLGDRAFAAAGPCLWNNILTNGIDPWLDLSLDSFFLLETENVFNCWRHQCLVTVAFRCCVVYKFSYLLLLYFHTKSILDFDW